MTRELIVVLDWIGDALPWGSFTRFPGRRDTPLTLPHPPPMAGPPWCQSKEVTCIGVASPLGIGWMKHPLRKGSHLGKENQRTLKGDKVSW